MRLLRGYVVIIAFFIAAPTLVVLISAFNGAELLDFPPSSLSFRWFRRFWESDVFRNAFLASLRLAAVTTVLSVVLGTTAALYLSRVKALRTRLFALLLVAPLQLPAILTGIALLIFLRATDLLDTSGGGLVVGHVLVTMPFVFIIVSAALANLGIDLEEAARSLGAGRATTLRRITLPLLRGPIISGAAFSFLASWDHFPISLMLSGVGTNPLPVQLFDYLRDNFDPLPAAVSTVSVMFSAVGLYLIYRARGFESFTGS